MKRKWNLLECLSVFSVSLSVFSGCGENPHVSQADQTAAEGLAPVAAPTVPAEQPQVTQLVDTHTSIVPDVATVVAPVLPIVGPTGPSGAGAVIPQVLHGVDGARGATGAAGLNACTDDGVYPISPSVESLDNLHLSAMSRDNASGFPYRLEGRVRARRIRIPLVSIGRGNVSEGRPGEHVNNAMVVFNVRLDLPPKRFVRTDMELLAEIDLNLYKHSVDSFPDTEMICLLDSQICSGREFTHPDWVAMVNPTFGTGSETGARRFIRNRYFALELGDSIERNATATQAGGRTGRTGRVRRAEYSGRITLNLAKLLAEWPSTLTDANVRGNPDAIPQLTNEQLLNLLYGANAPDDQPVARTLQFLVADDVMVRDASFRFTFHYRACERQTFERSRGVETVRPVEPPVAQPIAPDHPVTTDVATGPVPSVSRPATQGTLSPLPAAPRATDDGFVEMSDGGAAIGITR